MLRVVDLDVAAQHEVAGGAVIVEAVAPELLFVGQHVAVARERIKLVGFFVFAPVGVEVVALLVPDVGVVEKVGVVGLQVVNDRIPLELVGFVAHFDALDAGHLPTVGIVVAAVRFEQVFAFDHHAAVPELAHVVERVEQEPAGVKRGVAIDDLHQLGIDPRFVLQAVVVGPVAVHIGRILVDEHVAEALDEHVVVAHGAVAGDDRSVVVGGEVPYQTHDRGIADFVGIDLVGGKIDQKRVLGRGCRRRIRGCGRLRPAAGGEHAGHGQRHDQCREQPAHLIFPVSASVCSRMRRRGIRAKYRRTCRRSCG